jgi:hypothetical protein
VIISEYATRQYGTDPLLRTFLRRISFSWGLMAKLDGGTGLPNFTEYFLVSVIEDSPIGWHVSMEVKPTCGAKHQAIRESRVFL